MPKHWNPVGPCAYCDAELFTDGFRTTDTWDSAFCVSPSAPGPRAGTPHTLDPEKAERRRRQMGIML